MADLIVTATSVVAGSGAQIETGVLGATLTAGVPVYKDSTDSNKLKAAQCDGTAAEAAVVGILLNGGAANQRASYITAGDLAMGATVAATALYVLSATAGGIAPHADLVSTNRLTILAYGTSVTNVYVTIKNTGIQKA